LIENGEKSNGFSATEVRLSPKKSSPEIFKEVLTTIHENGNPDEEKVLIKEKCLIKENGIMQGKDLIQEKSEQVMLLETNIDGKQEALDGKVSKVEEKENVKLEKEVFTTKQRNLVFANGKKEELIIKISTIEENENVKSDKEEIKYQTNEKVAELAENSSKIEEETIKSASEIVQPDKLAIEEKDNSPSETEITIESSLEFPKTIEGQNDSGITESFQIEQKIDLSISNTNEESITNKEDKSTRSEVSSSEDSVVEIESSKISNEIPAKLNTTNKESKDEITNKVDEIQNKGDAIQNKVDEISTKVDEIQNKEDEIQNNEDEIQNKVDVIQNKVDEILIKVDEINKVVDIKSNKQSELEQVNKCETNEIEISNVSKDESAFRVEMDRVEELELNPSQIEINEAPPIVHEHNPVEAVNPFNHVNPFETDQVVRDETDRANLSIESFESIECMPETETPVLSPIVCLRRSLRLRDGKREKSDKRVSFDPLTLLVNKFNLID